MDAGLTLVTNTVSDEEAMRLYQASEDRFSDLLIEIYYRQVRRFLGSMTRSEADADDLTQETFLRMVNHKGTFKSSGDGSLKNWLFQLAWNVFYDACRRNNAAKRFAPTIYLDAPDSPQIPLGAASLDDLLLGGMALDHVADERSRSILQLYYWEGLCDRAIGEILRIPENTVTTLRRRTLERLREWLSNARQSGTIELTKKKAS